MNDGLILAIDQGTTNTKAIVLDRRGQIVARASSPMEVSYPQPGWAEQSAEHIWQSVKAVIAEVVHAVGEPVVALAISNQRETIVVWDAATGVAIAPAVIWQCRRSAERCASLRSAGHAHEIEARTGLGLDPLFPAAKIAWILDAVPGARARAERGELRAGTIDAWLLAKLTGGTVHATDYSNASRTQLFNTATLEWDSELGRLFDVPLALMPKVMPSDSRFGTTVSATALPSGVPILAMVGDSHAALYGHGIRKPGTAKATYGTGSSLMTVTPVRVLSRHGLSSTIAWSTAEGLAYAIEGNISVSGQAAAFMADMLGITDAENLSRLAATVDDANGVVFVPALVGLGAPHWRDDARGAISGLSLGTRPAHLARAAIDAIALQVADVFAAMESDIGMALDGLSVDGGPSRNDMLMQLQADLLERPVRRGDVADLSAVGAAMMARRTLAPNNDWPSADVQVFEPAAPNVRTALIKENWRAALGTLLTGNAQGGAP